MEIEEQLRLQKKQIRKRKRELSQLQEELESKEVLQEEEWQGERKKLKRKQDQSRYHADLLQNDQRQQLSEALGLPEEQPMEVLEAYVTFEKGKVAVTEKQALVSRQEHLTMYELQARDLAGRLVKYKNLLKNHVVALKERKEALKELESCGEKYTKELTECDQQLKQLQETLELAQAQLRSCEKKFHEYKEQIKECLDEMNRCEESLSQSKLDLLRCSDRLKMLRDKLTEDLLVLEQMVQRGKLLKNRVFRNVSNLFGYGDDQVKHKNYKTELEKCSKELEATEATLKRLKKILEKYEMELGELKECIMKAKDPQPTTIAASCTQLHQVRFDCVMYN